MKQWQQEREEAEHQQLVDGGKEMLLKKETDNMVSVELWDGHSMLDKVGDEESQGEEGRKHHERVVLDFEDTQTGNPVHSVGTDVEDQHLPFP